VFSGGVLSDQSLSWQKVFNRYALFNALLIKNGSIQPHWMRTAAVSGLLRTLRKGM
jgi:hypothetical protein